MDEEQQYIQMNNLKVNSQIMDKNYQNIQYGQHYQNSQHSQYNQNNQYNNDNSNLKISNVYNENHSYNNNLNENSINNFLFDLDSENIQNAIDPIKEELHNLERSLAETNRTYKNILIKINVSCYDLTY